jgi:hypothetical protein
VKEEKPPAKKRCLIKKLELIKGHRDYEKAQEMIR